MTIESLSDIGTDAGAGADELIDQDAFLFGRLNFVIAKAKNLDLDRRGLSIFATRSSLIP